MWLAVDVVLTDQTTQQLYSLVARHWRVHKLILWGQTKLPKRKLRAKPELFGEASENQRQGKN